MDSTIDYSTLNWVKEEIDETMKQARLALEEYVEDQDDATQLRFCLTYIHQVYGTLQMVELYGASLFSEEMEQLVQALLANEVSQREDAHEVLMRAILQLPEYLERIQRGMKDNPLILMPIMNDLRTARGAALLSESALFTPELDDAEPIVVEESVDLFGVDPKALAKKMRPLYQIGLLGWYRDKGTKDSLKKIIKVLGQLEQVCSRDEAVRLWWVAKGIGESLLADGVEGNITLKLLLGHVDREIKRMIDLGEQELATAPADDLLKNLLYYVAQSKPVTERVKQIKEKYNLAATLKSGEEIESARESLSGPNAQLMETVSVAITEDLARVKDALDLLLRSDERDMNTLEPQIDVLKKMADTLGMLGMGVPRKVIQEQVGVITSMVSGELAPDESRLMEVAGALLFVESSLVGMVESSHAEEEQVARRPDVASEASLADSEMRQIEDTVLKEITVEIAKSKDAIVAFLDAPMDFNQLEVVPGLFETAQGGMRMMGLEQAAGLLDAASNYISDDLIKRTSAPSQEELDHIADVISSVEYYLEAIREQRPHTDVILDVAYDSMSKLGYDIERTKGIDTSNTVAAQAVEPEPVVEESHSPANEDSMMIDAGDLELPVEQTDEEPPLDFDLSELSGEIELVSEPEEAEPAAEVEEFVADTVEEAAPEAEEIVAEVVDEAPQADEPEPETQQETVAEAEKPAAPAAFTLPDDIDEDILDIFIEEAEEVLDEIKENLPAWKADLDNQDALTNVRRSFHTLKGSGRLVGANTIGEFAWSIESMLNRVLDDTIKPSDDMLGLLDKVVDSLPSLIGELRGEAATGVDVPAMVAEAERLMSGDEKPEPSAEDSLIIEADLSTLEAEPETEPEADVIKVMDPVLYEIFNKESSGHLEDINQYLESIGGKPEEECEVTDDLIRALHTLHGSARMAGADDIAEVSGSLEKYAKILHENNSPLNSEGQALLALSLNGVNELLSLINTSGEPKTDVSGLVDKVKVLHQVEVDKQEAHLREEQEEALRQQEQQYEQQVDAGEAVELEEEIDQEVVEVFLEEAVEILDSSEVIIQKLAENHEDSEAIAELQRELHTLKGGARMSGIAAVGDLSHSMESVLTAVVEEGLKVTPESVEVMQRTLDRLVKMVDQTNKQEKLENANDLIAELKAVQEGKPVEAVAEETAIKEVEDKTVEEAPVEEAEAIDKEPSAEVIDFPPAEEKAERTVEPEQPVEIPPPIPAAFTPAKESGSQASGEMIRVRADLLDDLVNNAGEVSIFRSRLEQQIGAFGYNLVEMDQTVHRLREQLRKLEIETEAQILFRYEQEMSEDENFDPLEMDRYSTMQQLSRALMETTADIASIQNLMDGLVRESETLMVQQARVNTDLQEGLMRTRMVSFSGLMPRLQRIVRQTCNELKKKATLKVVGEGGELDRNVLERVTAPLEHMLRNAISHGIEKPAERKKAGKPEQGKITLTIGREGSEILMLLEDDGGGMDLEAIRSKAIERGLIEDDSHLSDNDIMQFVLESGFSTAEQVTQISGRGVGMDVVNSEIKQLGGSLNISSEQGKGTQFIIRLPLTLAINHALLVRVADETYAIPLTSIEGIVRMTREELESYKSDPDSVYRYAGSSYQVQSLGQILHANYAGIPEAERLLPVLLVRSGDHQTALQVDALMGSREIVVKSVGPQLSTLRGVSGATILGDGSVVLILDMGSIIRLSAAVKAIEHEVAVEEVQEARKLTVMVVDDSITVRKVTTRLLERNDMNVITAKDGVDAVSVLQDHIPDIMLLDIEMPRMDGFELATHMRNEARLKQIPIIMITSRTGDKHRKRAEEIGVERYLGKPYQEHDLLENIKTVLEESHGYA